MSHMIPTRHFQKVAETSAKEGSAQRKRKYMFSDSDFDDDDFGLSRDETNIKNDYASKRQQISKTLELIQSDN